MAANIQELFAIKNRILGTLIKEARIASGKSEGDNADLLGIPTESYVEFERGLRAPTLPQLEVLAFACNVPIKHFWGTQTLAAERKHDELKTKVPEMLMIRQKIIGLRLKQLRESSNATVEQVAEKAGTSEERIRAAEQGGAEVPIGELEIIARAVGGSLDSLVDDHGVVGNWMQAQQEFDQFAALPPELRTFVLRPINRSYLDLAVRLSEMKVDQLRSIAEGILEITF